MRLPVELEIASQLPPSGASLERAQQYTRWLAKHHYENFTVATYLLPRDLRQHFYNIYAFCRWADDLADEIPDPEIALQALGWWGQQLRQCYAGSITHPVFIALRRTVERFNIPIEPFADLLTAFRQDQTVHRYQTWESLMEYCRHSANPVGRLVLYLSGHCDEERQVLSDFTCTALQLTNFWQDVSRDLEKDRIYIPVEALAANGLSESDLFSRRFDERYASLMRALVSQTRQLFESGLPLANSVRLELRFQIELFSRGGLAVLDAIESIGYNTLQRRPALGSVAKLRIFSHTYAKRCGIGSLLRALSQPRMGRSA